VVALQGRRTAIARAADWRPLRGLLSHATGPWWPRVLLTRGDLASRAGYQNACRTLEQVLAAGGWCQSVTKTTPWHDELASADNGHTLGVVSVVIAPMSWLLLTMWDAVSGTPHRCPGPANRGGAGSGELAPSSHVAEGGGRWARRHDPSDRRPESPLQREPGCAWRWRVGGLLYASSRGEKLGPRCSSPAPHPDRIAKSWWHALL